MYHKLVETNTYSNYARGTGMQQLQHFVQFKPYDYDCPKIFTPLHKAVRCGSKSLIITIHYLAPLYYSVTCDIVLWV